MSQAFYGTRISNHLSKTPEGYLICAATPICRTGSQRYRASDLGLDSNDVVEVYRSREEVLHPACIASFEGKPICDGHPSVFLSPHNCSGYSKGHLQNVRQGQPLADGETPLLADFVITDQQLIDKILSGAVREVSAGYNCEYAALGDGTFEQKVIRANHAAIVRVGRAGGNIRILDSASQKLKKLSFEQMCSPQLQEAIAAAERTTTMEDTNLIPTNDEEETAESYGEMLRQFHREPVIVGRRKCRESVSTAIDAAEDFEESVRRVRRKLLGQ